MPTGAVGLVAALLVAAAAGTWWLRSRPAEDSPVSPAVVTTAPTPEAPVATPTPDVAASPLASPSAPEPSPSATAAASPRVPASAAPAPAKPARAAKAPKEPEATPTPAPVREGDFVELTPDVTPPKRLRGPSVELPEAARRGRLKGTVGVRMIVTEKGEPIDCEVVESAGDVLDQAVLRTIRRWRFEPAMKDGVKVRVYHTVRFTFRSE